MDQIAKRRPAPEEVPVALTFDGTAEAMMMATPHDIEDFAYGFAVTEGILHGPADVEEFEVARHEGKGIEARFWLSPTRAAALGARRRRAVGPVGCGLCGLDRLDDVIRPLPPLIDIGGTVTLADLEAAMAALRSAQPMKDLSRGLHAAGFHRPGTDLIVREDIGRHNALDKLTGALIRSGTDTASGAVLMTSRVSVDLVQKCAMARCPILVAASIPTDLAISTAEAAGLTLIGDARSGTPEIYTHSHRAT